MLSYVVVNAEDMNWTLSDDGTLTISGTEMPDYLYSSSAPYLGLPYSTPWDYQRSNIKKVVIESGMTNIGMNAFRFCDNLTSIIIPNSVKSIGEYAFLNCSKLSSVNIPNSVITIGYEAFHNCVSLSSIVIPNSVTTIGDRAFYQCSALNSIILSKSLTSIGAALFGECPNLTSVIIPNSATSIGEYAFHNCSQLTSVTIGNSLINIESNSFLGCSNIKEIYLWNAVPPVVAENALSALNYTHTKVFVPEGSGDAYKYADGWKNFVNIYEMSFSPVLSEAEPITVSDGAPTVTKGYYKENTVTYVREGAAISKDNYASFCLPFAVDPADAQFKAVYVPVGIALYNTETNTLRVGFYKAKDIIPAGTPFLARLAVDDKVEIKNALPVNYDANTPAIKTKTIRTFDFYERSGIMSENDSYSITFSGSYKKASPANACTFNTDGSAGPSASVSPFRAYISLSKNATNAKIIASFEDEIETTGIKELLITNDKSPVCDLNGRIVNENVQKSGIYIKNGKKYIK